MIRGRTDFFEDLFWDQNESTQTYAQDDDREALLLAHLKQRHPNERMFTSLTAQCILLDSIMQLQEKTLSSNSVKRSLGVVGRKGRSAIAMNERSQMLFVNEKRRQ